MPSPARYPMVRLGEVIADLSNGWSPQCFDQTAEEDEWGVRKLGAVSFGCYNDQENKALPPSLPHAPPPSSPPPLPGRKRFLGGVFRWLRSRTRFTTG